MPSSRQSRIAALPAHLQEQLRRRLAGQAESPDAIPRADRSRPLPLSFAQQRLWFLNQLRPDDAEYNSAIALRLRRPAGRRGAHRGAGTAGGSARVAAHHLRRGRRCRGTGRSPCGRRCRRPSPRSPRQRTNCRRCCPGSTPGRSTCAADRCCGHCWCGSRRTTHVLLLTAHHIVTDGWSMGVLVGELATAYESAVRGETGGLAAAAHPVRRFRGVAARAAVRPGVGGTARLLARAAVRHGAVGPADRPPAAAGALVRRRRPRVRGAGRA